MIRHGWAVAAPVNSSLVINGKAVVLEGLPDNEYNFDMAVARANRSGAWAGKFEFPAEWRRGHQH
jgi:endonuclease YncB( thermonuclease family)